jgi:hypothetical protein
MTLTSEAKKPAAGAKTKPPVTLKHLAAALGQTPMVVVARKRSRPCTGE